MKRLRVNCGLALLLAVLGAAVEAQEPQQPEWSIKSLSGQGGVIYDFSTGVATATNGVVVTYAGAVLTADQVSVNQASGEVMADGAVRIQQGDQLWAGEHILYNFKTKQMEAVQFRTAQDPAYVAGGGLHGDITNRTYVSTNAMITAEDVSNPFLKVRAQYIRIIPGKKIVAHNAVLYVGSVPVFYTPYYSRNLGNRANNFNFTPGYRSAYGAFILGNYTWYLSDELEAIAHVDYRVKRGVGAGPDLNYHFGKWGEGILRYYYTHDQDPAASHPDVPIPADRQRVWFSYLGAPATNLEVRSLIRYQSDPALVHDFFEGEYRRDAQPNSFVEANKFWSNFSLDVLAQPRLNTFLETVERLPDIRLTGFRQQVGALPVYYESESSAGWYRRLFAIDAGTNGPPPGLKYSAARADTYHQLLLPQTFFGWLNFTPRVGGRYTYYSEASGPGAQTDEVNRGVFNTGAELSFKASRLWPEARSKVFEVDGLRHIVEPSVNYVFVPRPNAYGTNGIPQFDFELPSLRLLPNEFPDYNAIDSIDSQNVIRWGLRNRLQTKREGAVVNLVNWDLYTDWRLKPRADQNTFADIYSDLKLQVRSWLGLESLLRYDIHDHDLRMAFNTLTIQPNSAWSWSVGHYYLRDDPSLSPTSLGVGNDLLTSILFFRLNENWGLRAAHYYDLRNNRLQQQYYSVYRDLRSWTAALTLQILDDGIHSVDYTVALTMSLKAFPRLPLGGDTARPYSLLSQ